MNQSIILTLTLASSLIFCGCRDKEKEALERKAVETSIAKREARIKEVKKVATDRFEEGIVKVPLFDREAAHKTLVLKTFKVDLDKMQLKTREETKKLLVERATQATNVNYPKSKRDSLVLRVQEEYPLFKIGQNIAVSTRTNRGAKGLIEAIGNDYVKIGRTKILIKDIESPDPVCFNKGACEKQRRHIVHLNFDAPRRDELVRQQKRLLPAVFKECGYVMHQGKWHRIDELYKSVIVPLIKKQEEAYVKETEAKTRKDIETDMLKEGLLPFPDPIENPYAEKD